MPVNLENKEDFHTKQGESLVCRQKRELLQNFHSATAPLKIGNQLCVSIDKSAHGYRGDGGHQLRDSLLRQIGGGIHSEICYSDGVCHGKLETVHRLCRFNDHILHSINPFEEREHRSPACRR